MTIVKSPSSKYWKSFVKAHIKASAFNFVAQYQVFASIKNQNKKKSIFSFHSCSADKAQLHIFFLLPFMYKTKGFEKSKNANVKKFTRIFLNRFHAWSHSFEGVIVRNLKFDFFLEPDNRFFSLVWTVQRRQEWFFNGLFLNPLIFRAKRGFTMKIYHWTNF